MALQVGQIRITTGKFVAFLVYLLIIVNCIYYYNCYGNPFTNNDTGIGVLIPIAGFLVSVGVALWVVGYVIVTYWDN